jgi:hypothetical protein
MNPDETGAVYQTAAQLLKRQDDTILRFKIQGSTLPDVAVLLTASKAKHTSLGI